MNHIFQTSCLIAAGTMLVGTSSAYAVDIDTFDDMVTRLVASEASGGVLTTTIDATPFAIGGERTMTASGGTGSFGTLGRIENGTLSFANTPESAGLLLVSYGDDADLNADLVDGFNTGFLLTVEFADFDVDYTISVTSSSTGPIADMTGVLPGGITGIGDQVDVFIPFSAGDFTDIDTISLELVGSNGVNAADLIVSNFRTVPEPSSLALLALGGLAMMRRRR